MTEDPKGNGRKLPRRAASTAAAGPSSGKPAGKSTPKSAVKVATKPQQLSADTQKLIVPQPRILVPQRTVSLTDPRRLTKKAEETLRQKWAASQRGHSRDVMMSSLIAQARAQFGVDQVFASRIELEQLAIGIPTPSLAFEYLIANDVFPLSSVLMLAGSWGTCKSALAYEFFRWFFEQNGISIHVDTEVKFDAQFACDIMRVPSDSMPIISNRASTVDEMQKIVTHYVREMKKLLLGTKEEPGPGKTVPVCLCVDSLAGVGAEENIEKIMKAGQASRMHPIAALLNSHYLPALKSQIKDWPFTLLVVNHLKEKVDEQGNTRKYTLGGQTFNFHESFELRNSVWKSKFSTAEFEGIGITIECAKNSFGPTGRRIRTRFLWWVDDDDNGQPRDRFVWDWNWSTVTLLHDLYTEGNDRIRSRLRERGLAITCRSPKADVECLANFPAVGMAKDEFAGFQEVGQRIHDNSGVCDLIREALNIKRRYWLDRPYDEIAEEHAAKAN